MTRKPLPASGESPSEATVVVPPPFSSIVLDGASGIPLWRQLHASVEALIAGGRIPSGQGLPSERDLADALGVSRSTVKRCYDELRHTQRLAGRGRGGSVVREPPRVMPSMGVLKGFTEEMRELGLEPSTRLLGLQVVSDRSIASLFQRPSRASFLRVERIREGNGVPMTRELAWYDLTLAPALAEWDGTSSAYAWLREHCGLALSHAEQTVEAVFSSEAECAAFGFTEPQPCLLLKRKTHTVQGQLVEYVEGTFRGDAYVYRVKLSV